MKLSKLANLWVPLGKKLMLEGVVVGNQIIITEPEKTVALGNAWQPTFESKAFDYDKGQNELNKVSDVCEYSSNDIAPDYWIYKEAKGQALNQAQMLFPTQPGKHVERWAFRHFYMWTGHCARGKIQKNILTSQVWLSW